jgi:hypothetical protein
MARERESERCARRRIRLAFLAPADEEQKIPEHTRRKPTGRKPIPEDLPRVEIKIVPPEVERLGYRCVRADR